MKAKFAVLQLRFIDFFPICDNTVLTNRVLERSDRFAGILARPNCIMWEEGWNVPK